MVDRFVESEEALGYGRSLWPFAAVAALASLVTTIGGSMAFAPGGGFSTFLLGLAILLLGVWGTFMAIGGALFKVIVDARVFGDGVEVGGTIRPRRSQSGEGDDRDEEPTVR